jgi:hypothetical protein
VTRFRTLEDDGNAEENDADDGQRDADDHEQAGSDVRIGRGKERLPQRSGEATEQADQAEGDSGSSKHDVPFWLGDERMLSVDARARRCG